MLLLRDNGMVTIDTFMRIIVPRPIIQEIQRISLVCSYVPALVTTNPTFFSNYIINNAIEGNKYGVEILNNTTLGINRTQAM